MGHIVESVNRKSKGDAARWISRQVYRNICFDTTTKEKESQVSRFTNMTNNSGRWVTNVIKSKPTGLRGVTQSTCGRSLQDVAVNSRPMCTSDSRLDMYHQKECGGG
jgi:hypothetical protein